MAQLLFYSKFLFEIWPLDVDMSCLKPENFDLKIHIFGKNIGKKRRGVIFLDHPVY